MYGQFYCAICLASATETIAEDRHHLVYPSEITVPLCRPCHRWVTMYNTFFSRMIRRPLGDSERRWIFWMCLAATLEHYTPDGFTELAKAEASTTIGSENAVKFNDDPKWFEHMLRACYERTVARFNRDVPSGEQDA